jgi:hypothetical protein
VTVACYGSQGEAEKEGKRWGEERGKKNGGEGKGDKSN